MLRWEKWAIGKSRSTTGKSSVDPSPVYRLRAEKKTTPAIDHQNQRLSHTPSRSRLKSNRLKPTLFEWKLERLSIPQLQRHRCLLIIRPNSPIDWAKILAMTQKPKRKRSRAFETPGTESRPTPPVTATKTTKRPIRWDHVALFFLITIGGTYLAIYMRPSKTPQFAATVVRTFPHDPKAFTQGLVYDDGVLWESTGRYGESSIRKVDMKTGEILIKTDVPKEFFAEGCVRWKDTIIQLTWKEEKIFVYDLQLKKIAEHDFPRHGWGITTDGQSLIVSADGTSILRFLDPETFEETRNIIVRDDKGRIGKLNELEFVNGKIFANRWNSDKIYEINPEDGIVESVIHLGHIWPDSDRPPEGVLNGIAFNSDSKKLLVTGKLCPEIFEIKMAPIE